MEGIVYEFYREYSTFNIYLRKATRAQDERTLRNKDGLHPSTESLALEAAWWDARWGPEDPHG